MIYIKHKNSDKELQYNFGSLLTILPGTRLLAINGEEYKYFKDNFPALFPREYTRSNSLIFEFVPPRSDPFILILNTFHWLRTYNKPLDYIGFQPSFEQVVKEYRERMLQPK